VTQDPVSPKYVVTYLFNDEVGPNLDFKALSVDAELKQDFSFFAIQNPSTTLAEPQNLPTIIGVMRENENYAAGSIFNL
jgi:hypothetical protein